MKNGEIARIAAGPLLFLFLFFLPPPQGLTPQAWRAAAVAAWVAVWWVSEAVPLAAASLIPLIFYPLLSVMDPAQTAKAYADPLIFLFAGGFMIALAMQKWGLHQRIALYVIAAIGRGPRRILLGFMLATAFIAMWVSNTATAMMMMPVGMAVADRHAQRDNFGSTVMLGIAYACSIGGVATLVGSPTNMIFAGQTKMLFPELPEIGFMNWFLFAFPVAVGFLAVTWATLAFVVMRAAPGTAVSDRKGRLSELGPWTFEQRAVMTVFVLTAAAWIFKGKLGFGGLHDGAIAMIAAVVLFVTPARAKVSKFLMDWNWAKKMPWQILTLFGGGFALAESFRVTGLAEWMGAHFQRLGGLPLPAVILFLCLGTAFLSEFMSNTAQVALMMPVLAAASGALGIHPYILTISATVMASLSFMLPSGTAPRAIVLGSGRVTIGQMARPGFVLNVLSALWTTLMVLTLGRAVFRI